MVDPPILAAVLAQAGTPNAETLTVAGALALLSASIGAVARYLGPVWRASIEQRKAEALAKLDAEKAEREDRDERRKAEREEFAAVIQATRELPQKVDAMGSALAAAIRDGLDKVGDKMTAAIEGVHDRLDSEQARRVQEIHAAIVGPTQEQRIDAGPMSGRLAPPPPRQRAESRPR